MQVRTRTWISGPRQTSFDPEGRSAPSPAGPGGCSTFWGGCNTLQVQHRQVHIGAGATGQAWQGSASPGGRNTYTCCQPNTCCQSWQVEHILGQVQHILGRVQHILGRVRDILLVGRVQHILGLGRVQHWPWAGHRDNTRPRAEVYIDASARALDGQPCQPWPA
jgi:hypothetical protein